MKQGMNREKAEEEFVSIENILDDATATYLEGVRKRIVESDLIFLREPCATGGMLQHKV